MTRWAFYDGRWRQGDPEAERAAGVTVWGVVENPAHELAAALPADAFHPRDLDDVHFGTRAEWDQHVRDVQATHPHLEVVVESHSPARARARADEARHAFYSRNPTIDERMVRERHEEVRRKKLERGVR